MQPEAETENPLAWEDYAKAALQRRWWILGTLFVCWSTVWAASWLLPVRYRSETLIMVEQQKVPQEYVVSNISPNDLQQRVQSMTEQILSRTRLQQIIKDMHLYSYRGDAPPPDGLIAQMRKDINIQLVQTPDRQDVNAFRISYSARNPQLAQQVASQLTSLFIAENLRAQQEQSETTTEFLSKELDQARTSLAEQETKVREFKARYLGQLPSEMQNNLSILTGLQNRYETLASSLNHSRQQKLYLESLLNQYRLLEPSSDSQHGTQTLPTIDQELTRLRGELEQAQSRYTDEHPDVVRLKNQLAKAEQLKQQLEANLAKRQNDKPETKGATGLAGLQTASPAMQIEGQLKANEQEIKDTQAQMASLEQQIRNYQARLSMAPVREQQLSDLTRDYDQSKANYDSLLKKQMQSQMATNLEKRQEGQQFQALDPPNLPQRPYWPDRMKFSLGGLGAGLALGIVMAAFMEVVDGRVRSEKDLKTLLAQKVLVSIPHISEGGERRRQVWRYVFEGTAVVILLGLVAAGNALSFFKG